MNTIKHFMQDEEGAVAIEYALLAALIAVVIIVGASFLGKSICALFNGIATGLQAPLTAQFTPVNC